MNRSAKTPNRGSWTLVGLLTLLVFVPQGSVQAQSEEIRAAFESYQELQKEGRYREALPFAQEVVRRMEEGLGRDHPAVAIALNHLASLYYYQGRYSPAELLYQRGLAIKEKALSLTAHLSHLFEDGHCRVSKELVQEDLIC